VISPDPRKKGEGRSRGGKGGKGRGRKGGEGRRGREGLEGELCGCKFSLKKPCGCFHIGPYIKPKRR